MHTRSLSCLFSYVCVCEHLSQVLGRYAVKGMLNIESLHRAASTELKLRKLSTHNLVALWRACGPTPTQAYDDRSILEHMPPLHAARGHHVHFNEKPVHLLDLRSGRREC